MYLGHVTVVTFAVSIILSTTGLRLSIVSAATSLSPSKRAMSNGIIQTIDSHNSSTYLVSQVYKTQIKIHTYILIELEVRPTDKLHECHIDSE